MECQRAHWRSTHRQLCKQASPGDIALNERTPTTLERLDQLFQDNILFKSGLNALARACARVGMLIGVVIDDAFIRQTAPQSILCVIVGPELPESAEAIRTALDNTSREYPIVVVSLLDDSDGPGYRLDTQLLYVEIGLPRAEFGVARHFAGLENTGSDLLSRAARGGTRYHDCQFFLRPSADNRGLDVVTTTTLVGQTSESSDKPFVTH